MSTGLTAASLRLLSMGGRFLLLLLIGRLLTPEEMGAFGLFAATCVVLTQAVGLELHQPAIREVLRLVGTAREPVVRAQLLVYKYTYFLLPVALAVAYSMGAVSAKHVFLLGLVVVGSHLTLEAHRLLIAASKADQAFMVQSIGQGLWVYPLAAAMVLLPSIRHLSFILLTWACASLAATIVGFRCLQSTGLLTPGLRIKADTAFLRGAWPSAVIFMASSTAFVLIDSVDRYFLEHFRGHADVGVYTLYAGVTRALREIGFAAIVSTSMPMLITAAQRREATRTHDELRRLTRRLTTFVLAAAPAIGLGFLLILPLLNDSRYGTALPAYWMLLLSGVVGTLAMIPHYVLYAAGRERTILSIHLATLVVALLANWLLIPPYGIEGAALASLLSALIMFALKGMVARGTLAGDTSD